MNTLDWEEAERLNLEQARDIPCYEAKVDGGKYRVAPVVYVYDQSGNRIAPYVGYEAYFIPTWANSWADTRDIAEFLNSMDEAKSVAERDFAAQ
jgi:hypothetical protein